MTPQLQESLLFCAMGGAKIIPASDLTKLYTADSALLRFHEEANRIRESAHKEATQIREDALSDAEENRKNGYIRGVKEAKLEQAALLQEAVCRRDFYWRNAESGLIQVVVDAVRSLCNEFTDLEKVKVTVGRALTSLRTGSIICIRIGPLDYMSAVDIYHALAKEHVALQNVKLFEDPELRGGSCTIVSDLGAVSCDFQTQIEALLLTLNSVLESYAGSDMTTSFKNTHTRFDHATDQYHTKAVDIPPVK